MKCINCGSFAINEHLHGRIKGTPDLCDVCYWRKRAEELESLGTVYIYPEGWNSFKMGGAPSIEDYETIHLPDYGK